jgi:hypothetical protein
MRGEVLLQSVAQDEAVMIDSIDSPYSSIPSLKDAMYGRGLEVPQPDKADGSGVSGETPRVTSDTSIAASIN